MATAISTAIGSERRSRVSGYKILKGVFGNATPNLPQQIVILAEANTANQATLPLAPDGVTPLATEITSAAQAGNIYGFGSPIYQIMRILRPVNGDGIGGIPTIVMAQLAAGGATATVLVWTITGTPNKNITHNIILDGRNNLEGYQFAVNIISTDTPTTIAAKYASVINGVLGSPFIATVAAGVLTLTTKWKGATAADANSMINVNGDLAGLTYTLTSTTAGTGVVDLTGSLAQFESNWYTTVINSYGSAQFSALETFNGMPDPVNPSGRYSPTVFKPFIALYGSTLSVYSDIVAVTNAAGRVNQVTNASCPAPASKGMPYEAAANMALLFCRVMQDTPHLDVNGKSYADMPIPLSNQIGDMSDYNNRDLLLKNGSSTVILVNAAYVVQDFVTTYHPVGEDPLQFNYCRNLNLDWNVKDGYSILEGLYVKDHVIVLDGQVTSASNAIKPSEWKADLYDYFDTLADSALLSDPQFSKDSLQVQVDSTNPNRFNTFFRYKRTGIARIESTDVEAGF